MLNADKKLQDQCSRATYQILRGDPMYIFNLLKREIIVFIVVVVYFDFNLAIHNDYIP